MPLTEIWDDVAAVEACCVVARACVPEIDPNNVYAGDLDLTKERPSCRVYQVSEPTERGWTDERQLSKQAQVWLVTVNAATEGEVYATTILGSAAPYLALPGDGVSALRDQQVLLLTAMAKPVTIVAVGGDSFRITGSQPGQHLNVLVTNNMSVTLETDNLRVQHLMPSFWVARFEFEEQPGVDGTPSRAKAWATRLRGYLQAGLADATLRAAHIDFNTIVTRQGFTRSDRGKTTVIEFIDVQFSALQGLGHDVSSLDSFGTAPTTEVLHGNP